MNNLFADDLMELLETMSNELPAGEIHRLILYPDGSGLVESEGYEQFDFANIPDLLDRYECQRCGADNAKQMVVKYGFLEMELDYQKELRRDRERLSRWQRRTGCRGIMEVKMGRWIPPTDWVARQWIGTLFDLADAVIVFATVSRELVRAIWRDVTGGGPERRFWVSFTVSFVVIVIVLHYWPHVIGVLNGG